MASGPPPLTPKQQHILAWLRDEPEGELTTAELGTRAATKTDTMRRMLERLQARSLVRGRGRGLERQWSLSPRGSKAIGDRDPAPIPEPADRSYAIFRQRSLLEMLGETLRLSRDCEPTLQGGLDLDDALIDAAEKVQVFVPLAEVVARNSEDAYRQVARQLGDRLPPEPVLVAVAVRYWQPVPVTVTTSLNVSIG